MPKLSDVTSYKKRFFLLVSDKKPSDSISILLYKDLIFDLLELLSSYEERLKDIEETINPIINMR